MHATIKQLETLNAALEVRSIAQDRRIDDLEARVSALVENVNLLRGDAQRLAANGGEGALREGYEPKPPAPVRNRGGRPTNQELATRKAEGHPAPGYERANATV